VVINLVQQVVGFVVGRRRGTQAQAFGVLNVGSYNIGLFAIPYVSSFLGPASIVYASVFDVGWPEAGDAHLPANDLEDALTAPSERA